MCLGLVDMEVLRSLHHFHLVSLALNKDTQSCHHPLDTPL